ncbi:MAG: hypothetical protein IIB28_02765, partial [Chloroflexi bacterium]|nr:hypothetical protein [Chloroflexota bacterium]
MRRTYLGRPTTRRILRLPSFSRLISLNLLLVMVAVLWVACSGGGDSETPEVVSIDGPAPSGIPAEDQFRPFTNVALELGSQALIENRYPGVAIFDFDRDGDLAFYVT